MNNATSQSPRREAGHLLWAGAAICTMLALVCALAYTWDNRQVNDINIWIKPLKFSLSFGLHLATMAWLVNLLEVGQRQASGLGWIAQWTVLSVLLEMLYICTQAARGRASHFNFETAWERLAYFGLMGGAALVLVLGTFALGYWLKLYSNPQGRPGLQAGAVLGLTLSALATLITAGALASGDITQPGHWVGGVRSDAEGLPLVGWATQGGDLRVPHFFATHLLQALVLAGWTMDRFAVRRVWLWLGVLALCGCAVVALTFAQAMNARPFWPL